MDVRIDEPRENQLPRRIDDLCAERSVELMAESKLQFHSRSYIAARVAISRDHVASFDQDPHRSVLLPYLEYLFALVDVDAVLFTVGFHGLPVFRDFGLLL